MNYDKAEADILNLRDFLNDNVKIVREMDVLLKEGKINTYSEGVKKDLTIRNIRNELFNTLTYIKNIHDSVHPISLWLDENPPCTPEEKTVLLWKKSVNRNGYWALATGTLTLGGLLMPQQYSEYKEIILSGGFMSGIYSIIQWLNAKEHRGSPQVPKYLRELVDYNKLEIWADEGFTFMKKNIKDYLETMNHLNDQIYRDYSTKSLLSEESQQSLKKSLDHISDVKNNLDKIMDAMQQEKNHRIPIFIGLSTPHLTYRKWHHPKTSAAFKRQNEYNKDVVRSYL